MTILEVVTDIEAKHADAILGKTEFRGETTFLVKKDALPDVLRTCRDELGFHFLTDISSVDHFGEEPRFEVVYELYSIESREHLRIKAQVSEDDLVVPTAVEIWPTADWHEREIFDMMGIRFDGHPDLRRILMWDGYPYFPLRKDFPLEGKESDEGETAFSAPAPLEGGPFVTVASSEETHKREPRARRPHEDPPDASIQS